MNERIKELAIRVQRTEMPGVLLADPEFVDRFAELLVKEVADYAYPYDEKKFQAVLKHFGVE